jgi:hypothetical protein
MKKLLATTVVLAALTTTAAALNTDPKNLSVSLVSYAEIGAYVTFCDPNAITTRAADKYMDKWSTYPKDQLDAYLVWINELDHGKQAENKDRICRDPRIKGNVEVFNADHGYERPEPNPVEEAKRQLLEVELVKSLAEKRRIEAERDAIERQSNAAAAARRQQQELARICYEEPINCPSSYTYYWYSYRRRWR